MKKFTKILLIGCLLVTVSCNNWLDVEPKSQVKDKDLFASEMGFKEALSGVYSLMTKEDDSVMNKIKEFMDSVFCS